jgi:hypothetical protein
MCKIRNNCFKHGTVDKVKRLNDSNGTGVVIERKYVSSILHVSIEYHRYDHLIEVSFGQRMTVALLITHAFGLVEG